MRFIALAGVLCCVAFAAGHVQPAQAEKACLACAVGGYFNGDPDDPAGNPFDPRGPEEGWPPGDPG